MRSLPKFFTLLVSVDKPKGKSDDRAEMIVNFSGGSDILSGEKNLFSEPPLARERSVLAKFHAFLLTLCTWEAASWVESFTSVITCLASCLKSFSYPQAGSPLPPAASTPPWLQAESEKTKDTGGAALLPMKYHFHDLHLLCIYHTPGIMLKTLHAWSHLEFPQKLCGRYYCYNPTTNTVTLLTKKLRKLCQFSKPTKP